MAGLVSDNGPDAVLEVFVVKRIAKLFIALMAVLGLGAVAFLLGMRRKNPVVVDTVRKLNKAVMNPQQMESAGQPGAYAAIIEHRGRKSGKAYRTPIGVSPIDEGFVTMLVYGRKADWLQNVLAAGSATIVFEGDTYQVDRPEVVPVSSVTLEGNEEKLAKLFGITECLRVHKVPA
jgi:deazaflavin-dependent oxidoreductase (nitroreductase family)